MPKEPRASIVGQPRLGRVDVRLPRNFGIEAAGLRGGAALGNMLGGIKDGLGGMMKLAGQLGDFVALQRESELKNAFNKANEDVTRRMEEEVYSKKGLDAKGSVERFEEIWQDVYSKHSAGLPPAYREKFQQQMGAMRPSLFRNSYRHEVSELNGFNDEADAFRMKDAQQKIITNPNDAETFITEGLNALRDTQARKYGQRVNDDVIKQYTEDLARGFIKARDGRSYEVTEEESDTPYTVTRERAQRVGDGLMRINNLNKAEAQNYVDSCHVGVVNRFLKDGRLEDAESYFAKVTAEGYKYKLSDGQREVLGEMIAKHRETRDITGQINAVGEQLTKLGGDYGTPEAELVEAETRKAIMEKYANDPKKRDFALALFDENSRMRRVIQKAKFNADCSSWLKSSEKMSLQEQIADVRNTAEGSALREFKEKVVGARKVAYDKQDDPAFLAQQLRTLNAFKLAVCKGEKVTLYGKEFDLSKDKDADEYANALGFTAKYREEAGEFLARSGERLDVFELGEVVGGYLGFEDPGQAFAKYPDLLPKIERLLSGQKIDPAKRHEIYRVAAGEVLRQKLMIDQTGRDAVATLGEALSKGEELKNLYMTDEQLIREMRREWEIKKHLQGDYSGTGSYEADEEYTPPTEAGMANWAREHGLVSRNGYWYYGIDY